MSEKVNSKYFYKFLKERRGWEMAPTLRLGAEISSATEYDIWLKFQGVFLELEKRKEDPPDPHEVLTVDSIVSLVDERINKYLISCPASSAQGSGEGEKIKAIKQIIEKFLEDSKIENPNDYYKGKKVAFEAILESIEEVEIRP